VHAAQDLPDSITFLICGMNLFGGWLVPQFLEKLIQPEAASALAQFVDRQVRSGPIKPSFRIDAAPDFLPGPSEEYLDGKFLRSTSIPSDDCDGAYNASIMDSEDRPQVQMAFDTGLGLGVRNFHNVINAQAGSFVTEC